MRRKLFRIGRVIPSSRRRVSSKIAAIDGRPLEWLAPGECGVLELAKGFCCSSSSWLVVAGGAIVKNASKERNRDEHIDTDKHVHGVRSLQLTDDSYFCCHSREESMSEAWLTRKSHRKSNDSMLKLRLAHPPSARWIKICHSILRYCIDLLRYPNSFSTRCDLEQNRNERECSFASKRRAGQP